MVGGNCGTVSAGGYEKKLLLTGVKMEKWLPIQGFEGMYEIANTGLIRSLDRTAKGRRGVIKGQLITGYKTSFGYRQVILWKNDKKYKRWVHRLVLETFLRPAKSGEQANHINGIKNDNRLKNLEWVTASENALHAYAIGLRKSPRETKVKCIETGEVFKTVAEAARSVNSTHNAIGRVCRGEGKTCAGLHWCYI